MKLEKSWHEKLCDSNKYILVDTQNKVRVHCLDLEEAKEYKKRFKPYEHIRIYKEILE